ncbi:MAG: hypothetical protein NC328_03080 [Muribaculum sp.]|nr:hypothetical protein [Muribaculum sp.]
MNLMKSKVAAWAAIILIIIVVGLTFAMRPVWWCFFDIFFAFMMCFCHLLALNMEKISAIACVKLDRAALVFGILFILALIAEYIAYQYIF